MSAVTDTPEEAAIRRILREELGRVAHGLAATGPAYLTVNEAAKRYRVSRHLVLERINAGELTVIKRQHGRNGRPQWMILASDAEAKLTAGA